jgi:hypothetical protein
LVAGKTELPDENPGISPPGIAESIASGGQRPIAIITVEPFSRQPDTPSLGHCDYQFYGSTAGALFQPGGAVRLPFHSVYFGG